MSEILTYRNFKNELQDFTSAINDLFANVEDRIIAYEVYFDKISQYLHDSEKNEEIKTTAGLTYNADILFTYAIDYCKINPSSSFDRILRLAEEYYDRSYYAISLKFFELAKSCSNSERYAKCIMSLVLLLEEIGEVIKARKEIATCIERDDLRGNQEILAALYTRDVEIQLRNLYTEATKMRTDDEYIIELKNCEDRIRPAIVGESTIRQAAYIYGQIYEKEAIHTENQIDTILLHQKAIDKFEQAIKLTTEYDDKSVLFKAECQVAIANAYGSIAIANALLAEVAELNEEKKYTVYIIEMNLAFASAKINYDNAANLLGKDHLNYPVYLSRVVDLSAQLEAQMATEMNSQDFSTAIETVMKSTGMAKLEKKYYEQKAVRKNFIHERHRLKETAEPFLYILQKWNSFTPILSSDPAPSKGGGYFITTENVGIVFDPGFDFIQNFRNANFFFNEIDHIFITHAHNDHTADLESILSLLHDYNEEIKGHRFSEKENSIFRKMMKKYPKEKEAVIKLKVDDAFIHSPRRKKIYIYISPGTKEKCGYLKLGKDNEYEIIILNTAQVNLKDKNTPEFIFGGVQIEHNEEKIATIFPIPAKHDDLMTNADCYGYLVHFHSNNVFLWYTGDTGFSEEMKEKWEGIIQKLGPNCIIVLLAHIGGFKPEEQYYYRTDANKAFYKNHLGRLGLCKLIETLQPSICLVSEFGEEFKGIRAELVDYLSSKLTTAPMTKILPVDIGFIMKLNPLLDEITNKYEFMVSSQNPKSKKMEFVLTENVLFREPEQKEGEEVKLEFFHELSKKK